MLFDQQLLMLFLYPLPSLSELLFYCVFPKVSMCVYERVCVSACVTQRDLCVLGVLTNASTLCHGAYGGQEHLIHRYAPSTLLLLFNSVYTLLHGLRASGLSHLCFPSYGGALTDESYVHGFT